MHSELIALCITAATIGVVHTVIGPDHYIPFVAMSKARAWTPLRTAVITVLCGLGHVGSSVIIGFIGIAFGVALSKIEITESFRGDIAAWLLTSFGLVYCVWGIRRAIRNKPHMHKHIHQEESGEGTIEHEHLHAHDTGHAHLHTQGRSITPWVLFTIFVFGPCEPLIPILMYPAATLSAWSVLLVAGVFAIATIGTMLTAVLVLTKGISKLPLARLERYSHALAGATILLCGIAIHVGL